MSYRNIHQKCNVLLMTCANTESPAHHPYTNTDTLILSPTIPSPSTPPPPPLHPPPTFHTSPSTPPPFTIDTSPSPVHSLKHLHLMHHMRTRTQQQSNGKVRKSTGQRSPDVHVHMYLLHVPITCTYSVWHNKTAFLAIHH